MSAPAGNKNAHKWTREKTDEVLKQIESLSIKHGMDFLTEAFEYAGVYPEIWTYWQRIWKHDADIIHRIKMVELRFHNKLLKAAMRGTIKPGIAKFLLESNYGYAGSKDENPADMMEVVAVVPPCLQTDEFILIEQVREVKPYPSYTPPPPMRDPLTGTDNTFAVTIQSSRTGT